MREVEGLLSREVRLLVGRLRGWSAPRWAVEIAPGRSRADVAAGLAAYLADAGRVAGTGAPAGVAPARLADHGLADQIAVLGADLLAALRAQPGAAGTATAALAAVREARAALDARPVRGGSSPHRS